MINLRVSLHNVHKINKLDFEVDLSRNGLLGIVGKNSVGKTTLIKALRNIKYTNTFAKTSSPNIFRENSKIEYSIDGNDYEFSYQPKLKVLDSKQVVPSEVKNNIHVELPIPHGERFTLFQGLSSIDGSLRNNIAIEQFTKPEELISLLESIYGKNKFDALYETEVKKQKYYFLLEDDKYYVREDYLSSGVFFLISLYKIIQKKCRLIVIDEIDISLDAETQVKLVSQLRSFCQRYEVNIVFTSHSLPLLGMLRPDELHLLEKHGDSTEIKAVSYNYVKSTLFQLQGWDRYILTEDEMLSDYLTHLISIIDVPIFFKYKIIYIGGASNVIDLMKRNCEEKFFGDQINVISILDGDTRSDYDGEEKTYFIPFDSVEKELFRLHKIGMVDEEPERDFLRPKREGKQGKAFCEGLINEKLKSQTEIFNLINAQNEEGVRGFTEFLGQFLSE